MTAVLLLKIAIVAAGAVIGLLVGLRLERHEDSISPLDIEEGGHGNR